MPNWTQSMRQTFEYYTVDPNTWRDKNIVRTVKTCTIDRDLSAETLGSATIDITESLGETYIRVYLITVQNGVKEKFPLGTFLIQTPSTSFDGKISNISIDAYTPLLELKESPTPIGYFVRKDANIMEIAYRLTREHARAPVVAPVVETVTDDNRKDTTLFSDFIADTEDTWCSFLTDLISNAKYTYDLDEMGRILFAPKQDIASLQPVWTYDDGNSSILYPEFTTDCDLYGIPNVVEVIYSNGNDLYQSVAKNTNVNSPVSIPSRGREIVYRVTDPSLIGNPTNSQIDEYAEQVLESMSTLEYTVTYTHGYCPVRIGDCVRLNYAKAGINNVKAKVISQSIKCEPGTPVTETATFTTNLWR